MNYKDTKPKCRLFFKSDLLTDFAALCLTDFRLEIHSLLAGIFFDSACELLLPWTKELYLFTVASLPSLRPSPPPLPKLSVQYTQTVCGCGGSRGVEMCCRPYSAGVSTLCL